MLNLYAPTNKNKLDDRVHSTSINGLLFIPQKVHADDRGWFVELAQIEALRKVTGEEFRIKQLNHSRSLSNVVRGMHAEGWNKVVTVTNGVAFCAIADVRPDSKTFGSVETFLLGHGGTALPGSIYLPIGMANSVCVVEGPVDYIYAVDRLYEERDKSGDVAISIFDPDLDIKWPLDKSQMILSDRDKQAISLREKFPQSF